MFKCQLDILNLSSQRFFCLKIQVASIHFEYLYGLPIFNIVASHLGSQVYPYKITL
jgi:hypothetical protein